MTPNAALKVSAEACPDWAWAAVDAALQALTAAAEAPHLLLPSCWQTKPEMTPIFKAEPWLKSVWSTAAKASSLGLSFWVPKEMAGLLHAPKSSAARRSLRSFLAEAAALQAVSVEARVSMPRLDLRSRYVGRNTDLESRTPRRRCRRSQSWRPRRRHYVG